MIQVTLLSAHEGQMRNDKYFYLTLLGGCSLTRPTFARQLLARRQRESMGSTSSRRPFFLTILGSVEIKSPTLAEEFIDLRELLGSGALTSEQWERSMIELSERGLGLSSFTILGGFDESKLPTENEEIDSLAIHQHLGNVPEPASHVLQLAIGQRHGERCATLHRAVEAVA